MHSPVAADRVFDNCKPSRLSAVGFATRWPLMRSSLPVGLEKVKPRWADLFEPLYAWLRRARENSDMSAASQHQTVGLVPRVRDGARI